MMEIQTRIMKEQTSKFMKVIVKLNKLMWKNYNQKLDDNPYVCISD